jgi:hypothetical protein
LETGQRLYSLIKRKFTKASTKNAQDLIGKGKGRETPRQAWTGSEGSRRLRLPDFKTIGI